MGDHLVIPYAAPLVDESDLPSSHRRVCHLCDFTREAVSLDFEPTRGCLTESRNWN